MRDGQSLGTFTFTLHTVDARNAEGLEAWLRARCVGWSSEAMVAGGTCRSGDSAYGSSGQALWVGGGKVEGQEREGLRGKPLEAGQS